MEYPFFVCRTSASHRQLTDHENIAVPYPAPLPQPDWFIRLRNIEAPVSILFRTLVGVAFSRVVPSIKVFNLCGRIAFI